MKTYTFFAGYTDMIFRIKKQTEHFITFDYMYGNNLDYPDEGWFYNIKCKVKDNKFFIKQDRRNIYLDDYFFKEIDESEYMLEYENDENVMEIRKQIDANNLEIKRLKEEITGCV